MPCCFQSRKSRTRFATSDSFAAAFAIGCHQGNVENAIDDLSRVQATGLSARFGWWDQFLDNDPLALGQIG